MFSVRPKILILIVAAVGVLLGVVFFVNREFSAPQVSAEPEVVADDMPGHPETVVVKTEAAQPTDFVPSTNNLAPLAQPDPQETTEQTKAQKIEQLNDLATNDDNESLSTILQELDNPDKDIRSTALEAAIQFGETTNTIARLKDLLSRTSDPAEQKELLEAIEFIALPSISELKPNPRPTPEIPKPQDQAPLPVPQTPPTGS